VTATDPSGNTRNNQYQVDSSGPTKTFTYDANGNLTSDGTRTFEWDVRNQLVAVNVGTLRSEFTYDGLQRRMRIVEKDGGVVQSDTKVVWCETGICEERAADGTTIARRAFTLGEQTAGGARFFAPDHLGSIGEVTNGSSTVLARYAYDPWGRRSVTAGTDITKVGYTGHQWQAAGGLWLTQFRGYEAELGRWLSEDPLKLADGPNTFTYVSNRVVTAWDPFGLSAKIRCETISGQGFARDIVLKWANARHCYLDVECEGKYHVTLEIYGPQPGFPNGKPINAPYDPNRRSSTWRPIKDCSKNCDLEDALLRSFAAHSRNLPPYSGFGPNSNTFVSRVVEGAGGEPRFPGGAFGSDQK
jgi:RHS repeat-associated protein